MIGKSKSINALAYIVYFILLSLMLGYFCLSYRISTNSIIFCVSILIAPLLFFLQRRYGMNGFLLILPIFVYYFATAFYWGIFFNPILPCLITSLIVFVQNKVWVILLGGISALIAFHFYPNEMVNSSKKTIQNHQIENFIFEDSTQLIIKENECLMLETWGKRCGQCFLAMKALGSFFEDLESTYFFQHEYIYIGNLSKDDKEVFFGMDYLKRGQELFQDKSNLYYDQTGMEGYPYFNFYNSDKEYVESLWGYQKKFPSDYKKFILDFVDCHCEKR